LAPRKGWLGSGAALGLAALARDIYLPFAPLLAAAVYAGQLFAKGRQGKAVAALLLAFGAVVGSWTLRNYLVIGRPIPVSRGLLWYNLWVGTWEIDGNWETRTLKVELPPESYRTEDERGEVDRAVALQDEVASDQAFRSLALHRWRSEPGSVVWRCLRRCWRMWIGTRTELFAFRPAALARGEPLWIGLKATLFLLNVSLLFAGAIGIGLALRERSRLLWFVLPILYNAVIYLPFHDSEVRFSEPILPFVMVFACLAVRHLKLSMAQKSN
jgi:hypothetical protein